MHLGIPPYPPPSSNWHIFSLATVILQEYDWVFFGGLKLFLATSNRNPILLIKVVFLFFCCSFQRLSANLFCSTSLSILPCFLHDYVWRNNILVQRHFWKITTKFNKRSFQVLWDKENFLCSENFFIVPSLWILLKNSSSPSLDKCHTHVIY